MRNCAPRLLVASLAPLVAAMIGCGGHTGSTPDAGGHDGMVQPHPDGGPSSDGRPSPDGSPPDQMGGGDTQTGSDSGSDSGPADGSPADMILGDRQPPPDGPPPIDGPFMTAPHAPFPQVPNGGGHTLKHPKLVTITFQGYPHKDEVEAFGDFIVSSRWLETVGADYGIGAGTHVQKVVLTDTPPVQIDDSQIQQFLLGKLADGTLPMPDDPASSDFLYMIYYPQSTTITLQGAQSCQFFGGYHQDMGNAQVHAAYAVIPDCGGGMVLSAIQEITVAASHEFIEAATDAFPQQQEAYVLQDFLNPWSFMPGEVGDLCAFKFTQEGNFAVQRIWSNTAAAASSEPCIPADPQAPYFNVSPSPAESQGVSAGQSITFQITGWSTKPVPNWSLQLIETMGDFQPQVQLDRQTINNGVTANLTITVPPGTPQQSGAILLLISASQGEQDFNIWPIAVFVQ